jgi:hypothetical protein
MFSPITSRSLAKVLEKTFTPVNCCMAIPVYLLPVEGGC